MPQYINYWAPLRHYIFMLLFPLGSIPTAGWFMEQIPYLEPDQIRQLYVLTILVLSITFIARTSLLYVYNSCIEDFALLAVIRGSLLLSIDMVCFLASAELGCGLCTWWSGHTSIYLSDRPITPQSHYAVTMSSQSRPISS